MPIDKIDEQLMAIPKTIGMEGRVKVTQDYIKGFIRAVKTFDHQLVFSPFTGNLTHLKNLKGGLIEHRQSKLGQFAGDFFDDDKLTDFVHHYARGNVHTKTLEKVDAEFDPFTVTCEEEGQSQSQADSGKFIWFSELIQHRVNSKKSLATMTSSLFVPESPIKSITKVDNHVQRSTPAVSKAKRKVTSPIKSVEKECLLERTTKRVKYPDSNEAKTKTPESVYNRKSLTQQAESSIKFTQIKADTCIGDDNRQTRSSRNVFRLSASKLKKTDDGTTSEYFRKTERTSIEIESEVKVMPVTRKSSTLRASSSPLKKVSFDAGKTSANVACIFADSDDSLDEFIDVLPNKSNKSKVDLNMSVSSIDEDDKEILLNLNGTPSSGYGSQPTATSSSQSQSQSPLSRSVGSSSSLSNNNNNAFTKLKSPVSSQSNIKTSSTFTKSASKRTSIKGSRSSTKITAVTRTSITTSPDIRGFFAKQQN